jgi:hypothetical protein
MCPFGLHSCILNINRQAEKKLIEDSFDEMNHVLGVPVSITLNDPESTLLLGAQRKSRI